MKTLLIAGLLAILPASTQVSLGQASPACHFVFEPKVEVPPGKFTLADLLAPDTCARLLQAAAGVPLGNAPLAGSVRVLEAGEVRGFLQKLGAAVDAQIPERITVRVVGIRASCADIEAQVLVLRDSHAQDRETSQQKEKSAASSRQATVSAAGPVLPGDCGAAQRIAQKTPLALTRTVWDPALRSWEVSTRCVHPEDCVPFLVRSRALTADPSGRPTLPAIVASSQVPSDNPTLAGKVVKPGQKATLVWDEDGFRIVLRVICLDRGGVGESVRARVENSDRILRAQVVGAGNLRVMP